MGNDCVQKGILDMSKNYLIETKEIKNEMLKMIEEIENNNKWFVEEYDFEYDERIRSYKSVIVKKFKTTYTGQELWVSLIYNNLIDIYNKTFAVNRFAKAGKLVRKYIDDVVEELNNVASLALNNAYSNWLEDEKNNDDRYIEHKDVLGGTYYEYIKPTFDEFLEDLDSQSFIEDYEMYNEYDSAAIEISERLC